jgi:hypothetical protein
MNLDTRSSQLDIGAGTFVWIFRGVRMADVDAWRLQFQCGVDGDGPRRVYMLVTVMRCSWNSAAPNARGWKSRSSAHGPYGNHTAASEAPISFLFSHFSVFPPKPSPRRVHQKNILCHRPHIILARCCSALDEVLSSSRPGSQQLVCWLLVSLSLRTLLHDDLHCRPRLTGH